MVSSCVGKREIQRITCSKRHHPRPSGGHEGAVIKEKGTREEESGIAAEGTLMKD